MSEQKHHKQQIDALTAWRLMRLGVDQQTALEAWRELIEGVPVLTDNIGSIYVEAEGTIPDLTFFIYCRDPLRTRSVQPWIDVANREVLDTEHPPILGIPVDAQAIEDLINEARGTMQLVERDATQYAKEADNPDFVARLERLQQIAVDTLRRLREEL